MKRRFLLGLGLVFLWLPLALGAQESKPLSPAGAEPRKKRVAILNFEYGTVRTYAASVFGTDVDVGRGMADLLIKHLVQDGTYSVIELRMLDKVLAAQNFSTSDRANPATAARIGKILGMDAIIVGSITQFGGETKQKGVGGGAATGGGFGLGGFARKKTKAVVTIDVRIVDIDTAEILAAVDGRGESRRKGTSLLGGFLGGGGAGIGTLDFSSSDFQETILGEAVKAAVKQLSAAVIAASEKVRVRQWLAEGLVAFAQGDQVILNVGAKTGLKVGHQVSVERVTTEVKDPASGQVIHRITEKLGVVEITEVREASAVCRIVSGSGFQVGDVAKAVTAGFVDPNAIQALVAEAAAKEQEAAAAQPAAPAKESDEVFEPSEATLETAKTIWIQPMANDLHVYIAAELKKQKVPLYGVTFDKRAADLWMRGTVQSQTWSFMSDREENVVTAAVFISARGRQEPLWTGDTSSKEGWTSSNRAPEVQVAKNIVKKLRKAVGR